MITNDGIKLSVFGENPRLNLASVVGASQEVYYDTTENWNKKNDLIAKKGILYVYSDRKQIDGKDVPGIKIGDGKAYLIDMPFIDDWIEAHGGSNVSLEDIAYWNNKVSAIMSTSDEENLVLTTERLKS